MALQHLPDGHGNLLIAEGNDQMPHGHVLLSTSNSFVTCF
jgi:hypothetical protein